MSDTDFLNVRSGDVTRPTVLPDGTYKFVVQKVSYDRKNNPKMTPFANVQLVPVEVIESEEDVNVESSKSVYNEFYVTEAAQAIAFEFCEDKLGLGHDPDRTLGELFEQALGCEVLAEIARKTSKNGRPYVEIVRFLAVE